MTPNFNRLANLERAVREANPRDFDMTSVHTCGTPHCAFGNYAARCDLQSEFMLMAHGVRFADDLSRFIVHTDRRVREHFGLSFYEITLLFDGDGCGNAETPTEAADFIAAFIQQKRSEQPS